MEVREVVDVLLLHFNLLLQDQVKVTLFPQSISSGSSRSEDTVSKQKRGTLDDGKKVIHPYGVVRGRLFGDCRIGKGNSGQQQRELQDRILCLIYSQYSRHVLKEQKGIFDLCYRRRQRDQTKV